MKLPKNTTLDEIILGAGYGYIVIRPFKLGGFFVFARRYKCPVMYLDENLKWTRDEYSQMPETNTLAGILLDIEKAGIPEFLTKE